MGNDGMELYVVEIMRDRHNAVLGVPVQGTVM